MAIEWKTQCQDCGKEFGYSDTSHSVSEQRGQAPPRFCIMCAKEYLREQRTLCMTGARIQGSVRRSRKGRTVKSSLGRLSELPIPAYRQVSLDSRLDRTKFGVSDEKLIGLFTKLSDPKTQVIVVEAPTGSGKSTFLPYCLLDPPRQIQDRHIFTQHGQIVVTQPRIQATINIPAYVSTLHGCSIGAGYDIGFRYSKQHASDWRSKLVYVTDGTLINWIAGGQLNNISLIMLDEAHERSLNIDLIIGLLTKMLPRYPWLKLIIASATIDANKFINHFNNHLRGGNRCEHIQFEGKDQVPVDKHFQPSEQELPYDDLPKLLSSIHEHVADKVIEILERMFPPSDWKEGDLGGDLVDKKGDILGFLYGKKVIMDAVNLIKEKAAKNPYLRDVVEVLPLYTELPQEEQNRALREKEDADRIRVIISTNVAETSLTIHGIKHVVETGIINQSSWDTNTQTSKIAKLIHTKAGCTQRWGRAGRIAPGDAWCLYTKEQFDRLFQDYTQPEILRSRLEPVVLTARVAGIDRLDPESFPWIDPPVEQELDRAIANLKLHRALDEFGDITSHGHEMHRYGGDPAFSDLMIMGDRFACAVEMATLLPMIGAGGHRSLLKYDNDWDTSLRQRVRQIHEALIGGCKDDLEFCLKLFTAWSESRFGGPAINESYAWPSIWERHLRNLIPLPDSIKQLLGAKRAKELEAFVYQIKALDVFDAIPAIVKHDSVALQDWLKEVKDAFSKASTLTWSELWFVNNDLLRTIEDERDKHIEALAVRKKEKERRPINFGTLDRVRLLFAWSLPDQCYLLTEQLDGTESKYLPPAAVIESERQSRSGNLIENDLGQKDKPGKEEDYQVEISDRSICFEKNIESFASFGRQHRKYQKHPNSKPINFVSVSFVVRLPKEWMLAIYGMNQLQLARFISDNLPPPSVRQEEDRLVRRRLFLDQLYPIFSQFRCRSISRKTEKDPSVDIEEAIRYWPASLQEEFTYRETTDQPTDNQDEENIGNKSSDLSTTIQVKIHADPVEDLTSMQPPEDVDDSDEDELGRISDAVFERALPPFSPKATLLSQLANTAAKLPEEFIAEVVGYRDSSRTEREVILKWPTREECFKKFCALYAIGETVQVQVIGHRLFPGDRRANLKVVELQSYLETEMEPADLAFHPIGEAVKEIPVGAIFAAVFSKIQIGSKTARLTTRPRLAIEQSKLERDYRNRLAEGKIIRLQSDRVFFLLSESRPEDGLLVTADAWSRKGRRLNLKCEEGQECNVRIPPRRKCDVNLKKVPDNFESLLTQLAEFDVTWEEDRGRLLYGGDRDRNKDGTLTKYVPISEDQRDKILSLTDSPEFHYAVNELYRRSNAFSAETADLFLEERYPIGLPVRGVVETIDDARAKVRLDTGFLATLPSSEFPLDRTLSAGELVWAHVFSRRSDRQSVDLTMREDMMSKLLSEEFLIDLTIRHGLINSSNSVVLGDLDDKHRNQLKESMKKEHDVNPWFACAMIKINKISTYPIVGKKGQTRFQKEEEFGVLLIADHGNVVIIAPNNNNLKRAMDWVQFVAANDKKVSPESRQTVIEYTQLAECEFLLSDFLAQQHGKLLGASVGQVAIPPSSVTARRSLFSRIFRS